MVLVLMSLSVSAFAAAPSPTASITFRGEKQGFRFRSDDMNYTATDLFDSFKNVMPGDNLTESISLHLCSAGHRGLRLCESLHEGSSP